MSLTSLPSLRRFRLFGLFALILMMTVMVAGVPQATWSDTDTGAVATASVSPVESSLSINEASSSVGYNFFNDPGLTYDNGTELVSNDLPIEFGDDIVIAGCTCKVRLWS